jgi:hypothetical protein
VAPPSVVLLSRRHDSGMVAPVPSIHPSTGLTKVKARGWKPSTSCPAATVVQDAAGEAGLGLGIGDGMAEEVGPAVSVVGGVADAVGTPLQAARLRASSTTPVACFAGVMSCAISVPTSAAPLE